MKNRSKKYILGAVAVTSLLVYACKKIPEGYISGHMRYQFTPINADAGKFGVYYLDADGSTFPLQAKLLQIRDANTHQPVPFMTEPKDVYVWNSTYNQDTDTTFELINKKRDLKKVAPFAIGQDGGQVILTTATKFVPSGLYEFDIEVTNSRGTQQYKNIGLLNLKKPPVFRFDNQPYYLGMLQGNESKTWNPIDIQQPDQTNVFEIVRKGDGPTEVEFKVYDKNGRLAKPEVEIKRRPNGSGGYLFNWNEYAIGTKITDTSYIYPYALTPWPYKSKGNAWCVYYRVPADVIQSIDSAGTVATNKWHVNFRTCGQLLQEGKYDFILHMNKVTLKR